MKTDTIAAIATAVSNSGIGIIRVSGDEAVSLINSIFVNKNGEKCLYSYDSNTIHYGFIIDRDKAIVDEVMVSVMKAPHSYTTEDTIEINCHGGAFIMKKIMELVLSTGVRTAQPGEFTKRAFLNGRIDLSEAEAVMDVINSQNDFALKASIGQLSGSLSVVIRKLREEILYEIAFIESALDDPEHISLDGYKENLSAKVEEILKKLKRLLYDADNGRILKEGINTVILGKPNVGKSSLLNLLVGRDKAIVTEIAGTTRDILEETINIDGVILNIMDTAGIRNTDDIVEKIGVEKVKDAAAAADLIIYVIDSSIPLDENDFEIVKMIEGKKIIILLNKADLITSVTEKDLENLFGASLSDLNIIRTSTKKNDGIDDFIEFVKTMFFGGELNYNNEVYITNIRHKELINEAYESILKVRESLDNDMPEDFYSIDLMGAYASLGKIIGEEVGEDLVDKIFSEFCMGK